MISDNPQVLNTCKAKVMTVGIAVVDHVYGTDRIPVSAEKHFANSQIDVVGGMAVNAALAIRSLGGEASILTRIGDDEGGAFIANTLANSGIDLSSLEKFNGQKSASSAVVVDASGERMIVNYRSETLFSKKPAISTSAIRPMKSILGDLRWVAATEAVFSVAQKAQVPTVLDFDLTNVEIPNSILEASDYIVFAEKALKRFVRRREMVSALKAAQDKLPNTRLAVTCGKNGVHFINGDGQLLQIRAHAVSVRSTLGAGDVFHGAFALGIAEGQGFERALRFANDVAAIKVSTPPDHHSFPTQADLHKFQRNNK